MAPPQDKIEESFCKWQISEGLGWGNFDRPQGEPPGPTERRRRKREREEEGEEKIMNIGYACLAFMNVCYYLEESIILAYRFKPARRL